MIKAKNYTIGDKHEVLAKKKARHYLKTLPPWQQKSVSAAIRWCIENAAEQTAKTEKI